MIACLDAGRRGICDAGNLIEREFIVISQVERQLLLGWKRENRLLQFYRHLIIIVDVIIASDELDSRGSRFQRVTSCLRLLMMRNASLVAMR